METAASGLGEVEVGAQYPQSGASPLPTPGSDLDEVAKGSEVFVGALAGIDLLRAADGCAGALPDAMDVVEGACLSRAKRDGLCVPATLVIRVHEQFRQLVDGATGTGDVTRDSRSDAVAVFGNALSLFAPDDLPSVVELAVAACRVTAGQVSEEDQISRAPWESGEPLP
ncbi:hypothetical protein [Streptomyces sp. 4F14]|uniref:hypothetical protein n=1 Tax=Streptomyces sp. 4F14 TaxID=3394380 RepID=UPI003A886071